MNIFVNEQVRLTEVRSSDKPALVEQLNDKEIYDRTLRIPYPYTDTNAEEWLAIVARATRPLGHSQRRGPPDRCLRFQRLPDGQVSPGRDRLLAGQALLGSGDHD